MKIPESVGVVAFGLKSDIITFDDDIKDVLKNTIKKDENVIENNDILCITEAVVAITQKNVIKIDEVTQEIKEKLNLQEDSTIGVVHPILSRNRFSMILRAIARSVPKGKVIVELKFKDDEQGNPITTKETLNELGKSFDDMITTTELEGKRYKHPETGMDYIAFYEKIIKEEGADAEIFLGNSTTFMTDKKPDAIIVSNVHERVELQEKIKEKGFSNVITLKDIMSDETKEVYSEYGLLGSNILDFEKEQLKLCPKNADDVCEEIKEMIKKEFEKDVDVIINGDGAYKDPESGIYELADPVSAFGCTKGIKNRNRLGVKTKYLMQKYYNEGLNKEEIAKLIEQEKQKFLAKKEKEGFAAQGTTPRKIENLVSSLADLITGSGDANTPFVIVRNFI